MSVVSPVCCTSLITHHAYALTSLWSACHVPVVWPVCDLLTVKNEVYSSAWLLLLLH